MGPFEEGQGVLEVGDGVVLDLLLEHAVNIAESVSQDAGDFSELNKTAVTNWRCLVESCMATILLIFFIL